MPIRTGPLGPVHVCCEAYPGHRADCWTHNPDRLPWAGRWPWSLRCLAQREPSPYDQSLSLSQNMLLLWRMPHGRCELQAHEEHIDHALRRGEQTHRWSTRWTA